ncbi:uncharacterized protein LOC134225838 [Armigeres subalbatus]|uniref:uncharacterized protein LOC134225838 n=1 Tax=Armigeres subalbatus TaxID=124917 RepID=UPI002ED20E46
MVGAGENDNTGYDYQIGTMIYLADKMRAQKDLVAKFDIGSAVKGNNVPENSRHAFDDVVIYAELVNGSKIITMLQVKHSIKQIDEEYLCHNSKTYVLKYFKSFLELKKYIRVDELVELIIWTNMRIADKVKNWFEKYDPLDMDRDVIGADGNLKYQRHRFNVEKFSKLAQNFLQDAHPRTSLVEKFVDTLFKKDEWNSGRAAKNFHSIMASEIIDCNLSDSKFKPGFINGQELHPETMEFRHCFEKIMTRKFSEKKLGTFSMTELNSANYRTHFQLKVDGDFKVGKTPEWKEWKDVPTEKDLNDFYERFVFYVKVPDLSELRKMLCESVDNFEDFLRMMSDRAFKRMVTDRQIENMFQLLSLRHDMNCGPFMKLKFKDIGRLKQEVHNYLSQSPSMPYLMIRASQDVDCTLSRLISVVESYLACGDGIPKYLVLSPGSLERNWPKIEKILTDEQNLKCLIITSIQDSAQEDEVKTKLEKFKVSVILVGEYLCKGFDDEFDVSLLTEKCKNEIFDRKIVLFGKRLTAYGILGDDIFRKENFPLVLELHRNEIILGSNALARNVNFIERIIKSDSANDFKYEDDKHSRIILSDQAGMGKSTEMINIVIKLREHKKYKDHLVIYFDCKVAIRYVQFDGYELICKLMNVDTQAEKCLIKCIIQKKKIILLLDGVDEVSRKSRDDLKSLIQKIKNLELLKFFIATRPHCKTFIENIFQDFVVCHLPSFSEEQQIEYLTRFWKIEAIGDERKRNGVKDNITELIKRFRSMLKDESLIGIPMQTYMIAVIYRSSIVSSEFELPKPHTIGLIYKEFVGLKFEEVIKRHFDSANEAHRIAIDKRELFSKHVILSAKLFDNYTEQDRETFHDLQSYGIVRLQPSMSFVHHTYYEYFLTLYVLTYKTDSNGTFVSFMQQHFSPSRLNITTKFLDHHIDEINPNAQLQSLDDELPGAVSNEFEPPPTARLHTEKMKEFNDYLQKLSENDQCVLIRNTINQSVFNVFEVLYDSLPSDTKSSLKFGFGKNRGKCCINLKAMGTNQIIQLLSVLQKKNPDNFIQRYLIAFGDGDEDFLDVACRKPFVQVLNWLVDDLLPKSDDQQLSALYSYVKRRFEKYLILIVQHNNTSFLEQCIIRSRDIWTDRKTTYEFLLNQNVLKVFLENVEIKCETKKCLVDERIKMVGVMYDLFKWASNENIELTQECTDAFDKLDNVALKSAFSQRFM